MIALKPINTLVLLLSLLVTACTGGAGDDEGDGASNVAPADTEVPVGMAEVQRKDLSLLVRAPGQTEALRRDRIRAPFDSRLSSLAVADGDHVKKGQDIATIVSKDSDAALQGARQMLAAASTPTDRADATRAIELAKRNLVERTLTAPSDGIVVSHAAETGDYIDSGEVLATIAETSTVYFNAGVAQSDVDKVRPGQPASIEIPALGATPVVATVQGLLPLASSDTFTSPVRLDFDAGHGDIPLGLFGAANLVVGHHAMATVVPARAVLRDDVTGITRLATVDPSGKAHWVTVQVGVREGDDVEILSPALTPGTKVITDGQVGLPEGSGVVAQ